MNYYQHHIGDFIRDTARLTDSQCMAYLRMLWMYYESEQPLPANIRILSMRIGATEEDVQLLLEAFFKNEDDVWKHARCDREISAYKRMSDGGKHGAAKRWAKGDDKQAIGGLSLGQCTLNANQEPVTNNHKPITNISMPSANATKIKTRIDESHELPEDWKNAAIAYWQKKNRLDINPEEQFFQFKNHHVSNGSKKESWSAAWRTWYCNAVQFSKPNGFNPDPPPKTPYKLQLIPGLD